MYFKFIHDLKGTQREWLEAKVGAQYFGILCCLTQRG